MGVCCESADKNSLNLTFIYAFNIEQPFFFSLYNANPYVLSAAIRWRVRSGYGESRLFPALGYGLGSQPFTPAKP